MQKTVTDGRLLLRPIGTPGPSCLLSAAASAEDLAQLRLDEDALEGLFADGSLERTAARFRSRTLAARVALLRETLLP